MAWPSLFIADQKTKTYYFYTHMDAELQAQFGSRLRSYIEHCKSTDKTGNDERIVMECLYSFLKRGTSPPSHMKDSPNIFYYGVWTLTTTYPGEDFVTMHVDMFDEE